MPGDPEPSWHQVIELPEALAVVTEYQGHYRVCPCCQHTSHVAIDAELKKHSVGPRLAAFCGYLRSLKVSLRGVQEIVSTAFGVELSLGTLSNLEREVSAALAEPRREVIGEVRAAAVKRADETGWKEKGRRRWLWVVGTPHYAAFAIHDKRGVDGLRTLLGETFSGVLVSDRWSAYGGWSLPDRQVCWAHLKRDFQKCVDLGGPAKGVGQGGLNAVKDLFEAWHRYRCGGLDEDEFFLKIGRIEGRLKRVLRRGCAPPKVGTFCGNLLELWPALWKFSRQDGVEPTNNHAERLLRRGVLWRKCSFGSQSGAGSEFVARMLTAVQTLRLQNRAALPWMVEALTAHRNEQPAPSLRHVG